MNHVACAISAVKFARLMHLSDKFEEKVEDFCVQLENI